MGGGTLGAIGSHAIDSFRWLLSLEVSEVVAMLTTHIKQRPDKSSGQNRPVTSDDEAKLLFRFHDGQSGTGVTGAARLSVVESGRYENRVEVYGTTGALMVEETGELWHSPAGSGAWRPVEVDPPRIASGMKDSSWARGFTAFSCAIVDALRTGKKTVPDGATFEDGYRVQLVLDAARESNRTGSWVKIVAAE